MVNKKAVLFVPSDDVINKWRTTEGTNSDHMCSNFAVLHYLKKKKKRKQTIVFYFRPFQSVLCIISFMYLPPTYRPSHSPSIFTYRLQANHYSIYLSFYTHPTTPPGNQWFHSAVFLSLPQPDTPSERIWVWKSQRGSRKCGLKPWPLMEGTHCPWPAEWGCKNLKRWGPGLLQLR